MPRDRKERLKRKAAQEAHRERKRLEAYRKTVPITPLGAPVRSCGDCQACCEVIAIKGDNVVPEKRNYTRCPQQCAEGCAIYSSRPVECRFYECVWREGVLTDEEARPDKLGVILDTRITNELGYHVVVFWEVWPGALKQEKVQNLIKWIQRSGLKMKVMVNEYGMGAEVESGGTIRRHLL